MHHLFSILLLASELSFVAAQRVVSLDFVKQSTSDQATNTLRRRQGTLIESLANEELQYNANITIGSPPQQLSLQLGTGSSDVWVLSSSANLCTNASTADQCTTTFDPSSSKTYKNLSSPFSLGYVDGTMASGSFFTDALTIGNVTLSDQQIGLVVNTTINTGILGIGLSNDESVCHAEPCNTTYPSFMDQLVAQGKIPSRAYSLYLNDRQSSTGSILFGGIDTHKYTGSLITVPMLPNPSTGVVMDLSLAWTNLTLQTSTGVRGGLVPSNFAAYTVLESSTSYTYMPDSIAKSLLSLISATYRNQINAYSVQCNLGNLNTTLNFQFGGLNGPTIRVPLGQLLFPLMTTSGVPATDPTGSPICEVGILPTNDTTLLFGDSFLRSAYVVYDLDNQQISLAQTAFNITTSDIREIQSGPNGVPGVATVITSVASLFTSSTVRSTSTLTAARNSTTPITVTVYQSSYASSSTSTPNTSQSASTTQISGALPTTTSTYSYPNYQPVGSATTSATATAAAAATATANTSGKSAGAASVRAPLTGISCFTVYALLAGLVGLDVLFMIVL